MSLRARLTVGVLLLVAVAIGAVSAITYLALSAFLVDRVDGQLVTTPPGLVTSACEGSRRAGPPPPYALLVARLGLDGEPLPCAGPGFVQVLRLSEPDAARLTQRPRVPMDVDAPSGPARVMAFPSPGGFDVVGLSLAEVSATLDRLLVLELLVGAVALAAVGAAAAWGVGRGLRPLTRVTTTARAVAGEVSAGSGGVSAGVSAAGGGLRRRVPAGRPGTEVGRLAEAFNTMLTAVQTEVAGRQDSEERMRRFLADASHELRTPLTSLRGYAELIAMRERRDGVTRDPESADALRRVSDEGARMARLVDDLLALARADRGEGPAQRRDEPVALDALASDAVGDLRAADPSRSVSLDAAPGSVVHGDPDQLRRVLTNLLDNAAAHTGGPIRVRVARADGAVLLVVDDDGPGLTPPQAAHAFDRFWRADSARTRARGGSGLGLSIVDALVGGHGGSIDFDTSPADGTTVTVRLPSAP